MQSLERKTLLAYAVVFFCALLIPDVVLRLVFNEWAPSWTDFSGTRVQPTLFAAVARYRETSDEFDLVFVGDSRTYCNIAPEVIDSRLGTRSSTVAMFGDWFPTQYSSLPDILAEAPHGTVFVWSIGHQNFQKIHDTINNVYPLGWRNLPTYLGWGYDFSAISPNLLASIPGLKVYAERKYLREKIESIIQLPAPRSERVLDDEVSDAPSAVAPLVADPAYEARRYRAEPGVLAVKMIRDHGDVTSLEVFKARGNYVRVELRPEYFRRKQRAREKELESLTGAFVPDPEYWNNFIAILDLFESYPVHLIVNEIAEAPYHYKDPARRLYYSRFMEDVRRTVEKRGIPYVRADLEEIPDKDYFDYNHLNSVGIPIYSHSLANVLEPHIKKLRIDDGIQ